MCLRRRLTRAYRCGRSIIWILLCQWINRHLVNLCTPSFCTSGPETLQCPAKALDNRICASAKSESKTNPYLVILSELKHSNSFSLWIEHAEERNWSITEICCLFSIKCTEGRVSLSPYNEKARGRGINTGSVKLARVVCIVVLAAESAFNYMTSVKTFCGKGFSSKCVGWWLRKLHESQTDVENMYLSNVETKI